MVDHPSTTLYGHEGLTRATAGDIHASMVLASPSSERSRVHSPTGGLGGHWWERETDEVDDGGTDWGTISPPASCGRTMALSPASCGCVALLPLSLARSLLRR